MRKKHLLGLLVVLMILVSWTWASPEARSAPLVGIDSLQSAPRLRRSGRLEPSSTMSNRAKGAIGEANIKPAMRKFGIDLGEELNAEKWFRDKGTLEHGIDSLYRNITRRRFNVVEAKATSNTGVLYKGILGESQAGQQMSDGWIKSSLRNLRANAESIAQRAGTSPERTRAANQLLKTIRDIDATRYRRIDKTLVVTRLDGVDRDVLDPSRNIHRSIHANLLAEFNNVFEVDRNGRVLHVYVGSLH